MNITVTRREVRAMWTYGGYGTRDDYPGTGPALFRMVVPECPGDLAEFIAAVWDAVILPPPVFDLDMPDAPPLPAGHDLAAVDVPRPRVRARSRCAPVRGPSMPCDRGRRQHMSP